MKHQPFDFSPSLIKKQSKHSCIFATESNLAPQLRQVFSVVDIMHLSLLPWSNTYGKQLGEHL
jgi:hypothetical protein